MHEFGLEDALVVVWSLNDRGLVVKIFVVKDTCVISEDEGKSVIAANIGIQFIMRQ